MWHRACEDVRPRARCCLLNEHSTLLSPMITTVIFFGSYSVLYSAVRIVATVPTIPTMPPLQLYRALPSVQLIAGLLASLVVFRVCLHLKLCCGSSNTVVTVRPDTFPCLPSTSDLRFCMLAWEDVGSQGVAVSSMEPPFRPQSEQAGQLSERLT